ncbi:hypothetical protein [Clostridioides sp. ZZV15-6597]|uniref:hypothetical protein n=1 Tax=Clostridioides sp. ZZV15-6597 TaxID=2811500 RepID=UPI001D12ECB3|nr:hypothetical protein [Clostridioides sp. ZZV15-6597]HBF1820706.1 hypothetical protein [Clostridioides difficile]
MLNSIIIKNFILYFFLVVTIWGILKENNLIGVTKGTKKARKDANKIKYDVYKRKIIVNFLSLCDWITNNIGQVPSDYSIKEMRYRVDRAKLYIDTTKRNIKPTELIGLFRGLFLLGLLLTILSLVLIPGPKGYLFLILCFSKPIFLLFVDSMIENEDKSLEEKFPNLYLKLYSKLVKRQHANLAPALDEYIKSLEFVPNKENYKAIKNFAIVYRNNIELYSDESVATAKLKDLYKSSTVVNYCNVAQQSLRGVDNRVKLGELKTEQSMKRRSSVKKNGQRLANKGARALIVIYIILAKFVILSWVAKVAMIK